MSTKAVFLTFHILYESLVTLGVWLLSGMTLFYNLVLLD